jgi:beta-lactamase class A
MWSRRLTCWGLVIALGSAAALSVPAANAATAAPARSNSVQCTAPAAYARLAKKMAGEINEQIQGRGTAVGLNLTDSKTGVTCWYRSTKHFYAASVIKVTILGALLRKAMEQHRYLTRTEANEAKLMITQSDNAAATELWNELGLTFMQHFLNLAGMKQTKLNAAWGLTLITAHDELVLLGLLSKPNKVLDNGARAYALGLMAKVIPSQRWGVPAGAPASVTVHVKNGWLPYPGSLWEINSLGIFTGNKNTGSKNRVYMIVMLTYGNPSMAYGINTIENAAEVIHRLLNPGQMPRVTRSTPNPSWGIPDETVPRG